MPRCYARPASLLLALLASASIAPPALADAGKGKAALTGERTELRVPGPLEWEPGTDRIKRGSETVLIFITEYLRARPEVTELRIENHVNTEGDPKYDQRLSERRARVIARWLVSHGIACKRVTAIAYGDRKPQTNGMAPADVILNNRTVFINARIHGRPTSASAPEVAALDDVCTEVARQ